MDLHQAAGQSSTNPPLSRAIRRKKKYNSISGVQGASVMDRNPRLQSTFLRWEKVLGKIPHHNYSSLEQRKRLTGGADKDAMSSSKITPSIVTTNVNNPTTESRVNLDVQHTHDTSPLSRNASRLTSDQRVDEIIDCAIKNLQEAGKALVTLGGNHEDELKRMLMEIIAKFQNSMDLVQKKLDAARMDLNNLKAIVAEQKVNASTKESELTELRNKVVQLEASAEATHAESLKNNTAQQPPSVPSLKNISSTATITLPTEERAASSRTLLPPSGSATASYTRQISNLIRPSRSKSPAVVISGDTVIIDDNAMKSASVTRAEITEEVADGAFQSASKVLTAPSAQAVNLSDSSSRIAAAAAAVGFFSPRPTRTSTVVSVHQSESQVIPQNTQTSIGVQAISDAGAAAVEPQNVSTQAPTPIERPISSIPSARQTRRTVEELERELVELRTENERIKRDHGEYEAAIERALLQGVSSLNAEALKVLRNPPFICYRPCEPCNPLVGRNTGSNFNCLLLPIPENNNIPRRDDKTVKYRGLKSNQTKKPCDYTPAISDIPANTQNSMFFVLPQQNIMNTCTAIPRYGGMMENNVRKNNTHSPFSRCNKPRTGESNASRDGCHKFFRDYSRYEPPEIIGIPPQRCQPRYKSRKIFPN